MWQGSTLVSEYYGGKTLEFFYDESGAPYGFSYKSSSTAAPAMYYYVTNLQGDVTNVLDASGSTVASYTYNAWGKLLSSSGSMASINPLRYRGYYFDNDTGLYYLKSRYYDPQIARFVNADSQISTYASGLNLFAYCGNNPVSRIDSNGHSWKDIANWFSSTWNKIKKTAEEIVNTVNKKVYSVYYEATKWHFEDREKKNGKHPTYSEVNQRDSEWNLLPESRSVYHDNGVGKPELKYITNDGREAVFDGDTLEPVTDPRYIATYNYSPLYQMPSSGAGILDYAKLASSAIGHFFADMLPYYFTGNSNIREQFESKIFIFN